MPACHASHVSIEEIDSWLPSTRAGTSETTKASLEMWCDHELQWVLFETNAPPLWNQLTRHLSGYFATLWVTGALQGGKPREAFFIKCDQSTMTPEDIRAGHLICVVGLASVKPAEFVLYRIHIRLQTPLDLCSQRLNKPATIRSHLRQA